MVTRSILVNTPTTPIQRVVWQFETQLPKGAKFSPNRDFIAETGISQTRFWKLRTGKSEARPGELKALATFFGCEITDLI